MSNFLVTVDGKYLHLGYRNTFVSLAAQFEVEDWFENEPFDYMDYRFLFDEDTGRVTSAGAYFGVYQPDTRKFAGYVRLDTFWDNCKGPLNSIDPSFIVDIRPQRDTNRIIFLEPNLEPITPNPGDAIHLVTREIFQQSPTNYKIRVKVKSFIFPDASPQNLSLYDSIKDGLDYTVVNKVDTSIQIISNSSFLPQFAVQTFDIDMANLEISIYTNSVIHKRFLNPSNNPSNILSILTPFEIDVVEGVAFVFDALLRNSDFMNVLTLENLYFIFDKHFEIINDILYDTVDQDTYLDTVGLEYFQRLKARLLQFYRWVQGGYWLSATRAELLMKIYVLFEPMTLKYLSFSDKWDLLKDMIIRSLSWSPLTAQSERIEHEVLVKIIESIAVKDVNGNLNYPEINDFMDLLNDMQFHNSSSSENLFQVLYDKIQDPLFFGDTGDGQRGRFVKAVYLLWIDSRYNPAIDPLKLATTFIHDYTYIPNDLQAGYLSSSTNYSDTTPSPALVNYQSTKFLLWHIDNFKFPFEGNKVKALIHDPSVLNAQNHSLFGFYEVFQPVSIKNANDQDTIIQIPVIGDPANPCAITDAENGNLIPIFYLKYIDDLGDYSDFKESIGVLIDVVLTFTGIGNITKARHLVRASGFRRLILGSGTGAMSATEVTAAYKAIRGLGFATWEVFIGTAGAVHSIVTAGCDAYMNNPCDPPSPGSSGYEDFKRCQAIQGWLLAAELLTLSGDLLAKRLLRRASKELAPRLPNDFPQIHRDRIDILAGVASDYNVFRADLGTSHIHVALKLDVLAINKRHEFMFEFKGKNWALDEFNLKPALVEDWAEVHSGLAHLRKNPTYLESYNRFTNSPNEVFHITDFTNGAAANGGFRPVGAHGGKNITNGVLRDPTLTTPPPPLPDGTPRPLTTVEKEQNGHKMYNNAYFIKPDGSLKKKPIQTIWNPDWDDLRIKGEMAFAHWNKKQLGPRKINLLGVSGYTAPPEPYITKYRSHLSDWTEVEFEIYSVGTDPVSGQLTPDLLNNFRLILK